MSVTIEIESEAPFDDLKLSEHQKMLYCSEHFYRFLKQLLPEAQFRYICVFDNGSVVAYIPIVIQKAKFGKVANSLPFFGSHGSLISQKSLDKTFSSLLVKFLIDWVDQEKISTFTLIENPFFDQHIFWNEFGKRTKIFKALYDQRLSQITYLPKIDLQENIDEKLLSHFHAKTRNVVRKSLKQGFSLLKDNSEQAFRDLFELHCQNMHDIGGKAKTWSVFEKIKDSFIAGEEFQIYRAKTKNGDTAAMLLLLFSSKYIEYFTPVIAPAYRSTQPLSFLIYSVMRDAVIDGHFVYWNWGGTWMSQDGVYRFKARWGAQEKRYEYITWIRRSQCKDIFENLNFYVEQTPFFYICPKATSRSKNVN